MQKQDIIVLPGLGGDKSRRLIERLLEPLHNPRSSIHIFSSKWESKESAVEKIARLDAFFTDHVATKTVKIIAFSAGGALATLLYRTHPEITNRIILVSAKIKGSDSIGMKYEKRAPSLIPVVKASEEALEKLNSKDLRKFVSYRPIFDGVVPKGDMSARGMQNKLIPIVGHSIAIGFAFIFLLRRYFKV